MSVSPVHPRAPDAARAATTRRAASRSMYATSTTRPQATARASSPEVARNAKQRPRMAEAVALRGSERARAEPLPAGSAQRIVSSPRWSPSRPEPHLVFTDVEGSTLLLDGLGRSADTATRSPSTAEQFARRLPGITATRPTTQATASSAFSTAAEAVCGVSDALASLDGGPSRSWSACTPAHGCSLSCRNYVGLDVHRAARIRRAAHAEARRSASRTTRELLDEGFAVRDLGDHRPGRSLGGAAVPARARRVRAATLRHELAVPATEFVGRTRELDEVIDNLRLGVRLFDLDRPGVDRFAPRRR